ncbi:hypothetical protein ACIRD6_35745 [Streptomyces sp. NPDC102473]|uniref:hypothetical protein n=1 Tax=Streptomyces sp. NPDC102473 TaxID=3366180 RepID=UPI00380241CE
MIVEYTPEGGEPERYNARKLLSSEAAAVGRALGMKWPEVKEALGEDDPEAMRAVAWVMRKRQEPQLRFSDFDPGVDEIALKWDEREITAYVDEAFKVQGKAEERDIFLRILVRNAADPQHAEALIKEHSGDGPKEPPAESVTSGNSETSTSDSSPTSSTSDPQPSTP